MGSRLHGNHRTCPVTVGTSEGSQEYPVPCDRTVRAGHLMCAYHWRHVPKDTRDRVWAAWRAWQRDPGDLLWAMYLDARKDALDAVTGVL